MYEAMAIGKGNWFAIINVQNRKFRTFFTDNYQNNFSSLDYDNLNNVIAFMTTE